MQPITYTLQMRHTRGWEDRTVWISFRDEDDELVAEVQAEIDSVTAHGYMARARVQVGDLISYIRPTV